MIHTSLISAFVKICVFHLIFGHFSFRLKSACLRTTQICYFVGLFIYFVGLFIASFYNIVFENLNEISFKIVYNTSIVHEIIFPCILIFIFLYFIFSWGYGPIFGPANRQNWKKFILYSWFLPFPIICFKKHATMIWWYHKKINLIPPTSTGSFFSYSVLFWH